MNCSNQISHLWPNNFILAREKNGNYESRPASLATKKTRNQFDKEDQPSLDCRGVSLAQKDINRSQHQTDVLKAYGIIPTQQYISSCYRRTDDLTRGLTAVQATIAGFLG